MLGLWRCGGGSRYALTSEGRGCWAVGLLAVWHGAEAGEVWVEVGKEWVEVGEEQVEVGEEWVGIEGEVVGVWGEGVPPVNGYLS